MNNAPAPPLQERFARRKVDALERNRAERYKHYEAIQRSQAALRELDEQRRALLDELGYVPYGL